MCLITLGPYPVRDVMKDLLVSHVVCVLNTGVPGMYSNVLRRVSFTTNSTLDFQLTVNRFVSYRSLYKVRLLCSFSIPPSSEDIRNKGDRDV